ncbi:MAG: hypothetical protein ABSF35_14490 [Polyangia bacterium]
MTWPVARVCWLPAQAAAGLALLLLMGARVEAAESSPDAATAADANQRDDDGASEAGKPQQAEAPAALPQGATPLPEPVATAASPKPEHRVPPTAVKPSPSQVQALPEKPVVPAPRAEPHASSARVTLSLATASPVLGIEDETELRIVATGDFPSPLPFPRILCSAGRVEDVLREGPTSFSARFLLPSARFPQVAIVVADFSHDSLILRGSLAVRLRAAASPAFHTDPGSRVTVKVGDKQFGPVVAPADGNVHVPVVVSPGIDFALARSVNRYGKSSQELLDLKIPPAQRALVIAPEKLAAGTVSEVAVLAVEPTGRLVDASTILLASSGPRPEPMGSRAAGEARFLIRVPASLQDPTLHLVASLRGHPDVTAEADVVLVSAPTAQVLLQPEVTQPESAPLRSLRVFLSAQDAFGNLTDAGEASLLVDGQPARSQATEDGRAMLVLRPPAVLTGRDTMEVEAVLDSGHATENIPLALFTRRLPPDPVLATRYTLTPRLGFLWNLRQPPGSALFIEAMASRHPSVAGFTFGVSAGYLHSRFYSWNNAGAGTVILDQIPLLAQARYRRRINRLALSVGAGAGLVLAQARLPIFSSEIAGRSAAFACEGSTEAAFLLHRSQVVFGLRYLAMSLGKLSSGDDIVGNSGGFIVDVGYRIGWQ